MVGGGEARHQRNGSGAPKRARANAVKNSGVVTSSLPAGQRTPAGLLVFNAKCPQPFSTSNKSRVKKQPATDELCGRGADQRQRGARAEAKANFDTKAGIEPFQPINSVRNCSSTHLRLPMVNTNNANGIFKNSESMYDSKAHSPKKRGRKPNNASQQGPKKRTSALQKDPEKREAHNNMERERRTDIMYAFNDLRMRVPCLADESKQSKLNILNGAIDYIGKLTMNDNYYRSEIEKHRCALIEKKRLKNMQQV